MISTALRLAGTTADSVNYVETHGTGTILGDPIEFEALAATYGSAHGSGDVRCALGSVKTNIGHLEAAAGITGFIKATLAVSRGQIPPNLHFTRWNPAIDPASTRLFVPTEATRWPAGVRRAAVSSFGLSGTNAHVVLSRHRSPHRSRCRPTHPRVECPRWWCPARHRSGPARWRPTWPSGWKGRAPPRHWPMRPRR